jgi:hypothetical protein
MEPRSARSSLARRGILRLGCAIRAEPRELPRFATAAIRGTIHDVASVFDRPELGPLSDFIARGVHYGPASKAAAWDSSDQFAWR